MYIVFKHRTNSATPFPDEESMSFRLHSPSHDIFPPTFLKWFWPTVKRSSQIKWFIQSLNEEESCLIVTVLTLEPIQEGPARDSLTLRGAAAVIWTRRDMLFDSNLSKMSPKSSKVWDFSRDVSCPKRSQCTAKQQTQNYIAPNGRTRTLQKDI